MAAPEEGRACCGTTQVGFFVELGQYDTREKAERAARPGGGGLIVERRTRHNALVCQ